MAEHVFLGGMTNTTLHLESDGTIHIEEKQDCQAILDANQAKRDHRFHGGTGDFQESYDVPATLVWKWHLECGAPLFSKEHMAYVDKKLKSPEYALLSTCPRTRDAHVIVKGLR